MSLAGDLADRAQARRLVAPAEEQRPALRDFVPPDPTPGPHPRTHPRTDATTYSWELSILEACFDR